MNHGQRTIFIIIFIVSLQLLIPSGPAWSSDSDIRLKHSDRNGVTVELNTPEYKIAQKKVDGTVYDEIVIREYGTANDAGKPALPVRGTLIGVPEEGSFIIKVTGFDYQTIHLDRDIAPYSLPVKDNIPLLPDKDTYQADVFYPGYLAAEGFSGYMRDQRVKQILFYPVQYNPVKHEARIYGRIRIELSFDKPIEGHAKKLSSKFKKGNKPAAAGAYEKLLKDSLLNYDSLQR